MPKAVAALRAGEWWEHKLAPALGTGYATAFVAGAALTEVWPALLLALAALAPGAAYVSLVNDLTDLEDDRAAGKSNRLALRPRWFAVAAIAACLLAGLATGVLAWGDDPAGAGLYAAAWVSFSLYSLPPVRLKTRGLAGAVADAAGAHVFPHLLVALVVFRAAEEAPAAWWLGLVGVWSLALGVRGALLHQLGDVAADLRAGVPAFGATHPERARILGAFIAFPLELAAFGAMLIGAGNALALVFLVLYPAIERLRLRRFGVPIAVVSFTPGARVAMQTYYVAWFPIAFLVAAVVRHPADAALLAAHVVLFRRELAYVAQDLLSVRRVRSSAA